MSSLAAADRLPLFWKRRRRTKFTASCRTTFTSGRPYNRFSERTKQASGKGSRGARAQQGRNFEAKVTIVGEEQRLATENR